MEPVLVPDPLLRSGDPLVPSRRRKSALGCQFRRRTRIGVAVQPRHYLLAIELEGFLWQVSNHVERELAAVALGPHRAARSGFRHGTWGAPGRQARPGPR